MNILKLNQPIINKPQTLVYMESRQYIRWFENTYLPEVAKKILRIINTYKDQTPISK